MKSLPGAKTKIRISEENRIIDSYNAKLRRVSSYNNNLDKLAKENEKKRRQSSEEKKRKYSEEEKKRKYRSTRRTSKITKYKYTNFDNSSSTRRRRKQDPMYIRVPDIAYYHGRLNANIERPNANIAKPSVNSKSTK